MASFLSQQWPQKVAVRLTTGLSWPPSVCLRNSGVLEPMSVYLLMLRVTLMSASMGPCQGLDSLGPAIHYGRSSFFLCLQGLPHSTWYVSWCGSLTYFWHFPLSTQDCSPSTIYLAGFYMPNSLALMLLPASCSRTQSHLLLRASVICPLSSKGELVLSLRTAACFLTLEP